MEKRKIVKPLVIATAIAAIAGIGAVSFAAWTSDGNHNETVTGTTGEIVTTAGFEATSNLSDSVKLVPFDQLQQYDGNTMAKVWEITLTADEGLDLGDYDYTIETTSSLSLYVFTGETYAAPTGTLGDDWTALSSTAGDVALDANNKIYVVLNSSDTADMGQDLSVTITATVKD